MSVADSSAQPDRRQFDELLELIIQHPERRVEIEQEIIKTFMTRQAVLILDMSGFTRTTQEHGIVAFMLMIHQTRRLCEPCIAMHAGMLVKTEADNMFCTFPNVASAVAAAHAMHAHLDAANYLLPKDRSLYASIGIGWGDVLLLGENDLYGDQVNLASKLAEDIGKEGDILLTRSAFDASPAEFTKDSKRKRASVSGMTLEWWKLGAT